MRSITWRATSSPAPWLTVLRCFRPAEFLEWEAKRMSDLQASSLDKAPLQATGFEGGFGGQEGLRDKYATTSGEH